MVAGLRRLRRQRSNGAAAAAATAPAARAELCDLCGKELPADHRHLLHLVERRILCTCESCLALRGGDPELRPTGHPDGVAGRLRALRRDLGVVRDPDRARLLPGLDAPAAGSSRCTRAPAGATESELEIERLGRAARAANPVLMSLEPDAEALIVNRIADPPEHAIAPIDECYRLVGMVKVAWEGISRRGRGRARDLDASSASCASGRQRRERRSPRALEVERPSRPFAGAPDPEFEVLAATRGRARRGADLRFRVRGDRRLRAAHLHDRAHRGDRDRAIEAPLRRRDPRAAGRAVRRARALGVDHDQLPLGAGRRAGARVRGLDRVRARRPLHLRPRARLRPSTSTGSRTARRRCASTSTAPSSTRPTTGGCRSSRSRGTARPASDMPVEAWREVIDAELPVPRLGAAGPRDARAARAAQGRARAADLRRDARRAARRARRTDARGRSSSWSGSLLYEGYALYPYTPGATKNATPTPFGIVYPPAYAEGMPTTFDHLRLECVLEAGAGGRADGDRALPAGRRASATRRGRAPARARPGAARRARPTTGVGADRSRSTGARERRRAGADARRAPGRAGLWRVRACVHNTTEVRRRARARRGAAGSACSRPTSWSRSPPAASSRRSSATAPPAQAVAESRERQHLAGARRRPPTTRSSAATIVLPDHPRHGARRASATCSTTPRSRRRCCCTSRR